MIFVQPPRLSSCKNVIPVLFEAKLKTSKKKKIHVQSKLKPLQMHSCSLNNKINFDCSVNIIFHDALIN